MIVSGRCMPTLYPEHTVLEQAGPALSSVSRWKLSAGLVPALSPSFVFLTALLIAIDWAAANGRLRRNQFVGIRTPSTMRSDPAWMAGHRAALRLTPLHLVTGVSLLIGVFSARTVAGLNLVGVCGAIVFVVVAVFTAIVAGRAAKAGGEPRPRTQADPVGYISRIPACAASYAPAMRSRTHSKGLPYALYSDSCQFGQLS